MNDTHFKLPQEKIEHFTVGYRWSDENGLFVAESATDNRYVSEVALFNGGGGLVSTTFDYLKFWYQPFFCTFIDRGMIVLIDIS